ncbi:hypothetical protein OIU34_26500 [Pararhizobium sp. BT-229]|uniref:hypothetical protein n=1 Tax=Pararhizobium sp. BT-229 TaxID=2986923 RepID=UPI0021F6F16E|nr:hypothetical protein [Pararhizobium sp. BT-229]MCV9965433.1 hypothetical protein [Pararhizobium sp. BT-229]
MKERKQIGRMHPALVRHLPTMSTAVTHGQLIKLSCTWCKTTHRYEPADLMQLRGNVPFLNIEVNFRCSGCGKQEYLKSDLEVPSAKDRVGMTVRRLVEIKTVQRPVWKDVKL